MIADPQNDAKREHAVEALIAADESEFEATLKAMRTAYPGKERLFDAFEANLVILRR